MNFLVNDDTEACITDFDSIEFENCDFKESISPKIKSILQDRGCSHSTKKEILLLTGKSKDEYKLARKEIIQRCIDNMGSCISDEDWENGIDIEGGCTVDSVLQAIEDNMDDCSHDATMEYKLVSGATNVKRSIRNMCQAGWKLVDTSTFADIDDRLEEESYIHISGGTEGGFGGEQLLSTTRDGRKVDLYSHDDDSGRQRWNIIPIEGDDEHYHIKVSGGTRDGFEGEQLLSTTGDGRHVDLYREDDGSGRQKWKITPIEGDTEGHVHIHISGGTSGGWGGEQLLSTTRDGGHVDLYSHDDDSGRQKWKISSVEEYEKIFTNNFMKDYIDGNTFLNIETGSFQEKFYGFQIDEFRDEEAESTKMNSFGEMKNCEYNSIMCCFGRDRQPNDNNGNCANPLDQNCVDADPADNSNLCYAVNEDDEVEAYPGESEGDIHCHGLAWAEEKTDFTNQLKYNNFFYVSLYDHMYTRGYVENVVDEDSVPMCQCIEDLNIAVSRSDCTQIDADLTFTMKKNSSSGDIEVTPQDDLEIEFNSCQGINPGNGADQGNDLASYVHRLYLEDKISLQKQEGVFEVLVGYNQPGNNENEDACSEAYEENFGTPYPEE